MLTTSRPLAGGFLTGKVSLPTSSTDLTGTRWVPGGHSFYPATFDHPVIHEAIKKFCAECEEHGISSTEASFRWLVNHSALRDGDGIILGATRINMLEGNLAFCWKRPLEEQVVRAVDEMWEAVRETTGKTAFV